MSAHRQREVEEYIAHCLGKEHPVRQTIERADRREKSANRRHRPGSKLHSQLLVEHDVQREAAAVLAEALPDPMLRANIDEMFSSLNPEERHVLTLTGEGLEPKDIAEEVGKTPGAVRVQLFRLRKRLQKEGWHAFFVAVGVLPPCALALSAWRTVAQGDRRWMVDLGLGSAAWGLLIVLVFIGAMRRERPAVVRPSSEPALQRLRSALGASRRVALAMRRAMVDVLPGLTSWVSAAIAVGSFLGLPAIFTSTAWAHRHGLEGLGLLLGLVLFFVWNYIIHSFGEPGDWVAKRLLTGFLQRELPTRWSRDFVSVRVARRPITPRSRYSWAVTCWSVSPVACKTPREQDQLADVLRQRFGESFEGMHAGAFVIRADTAQSSWRATLDAIEACLANLGRSRSYRT